MSESGSDNGPEGEEFPQWLNDRLDGLRALEEKTKAVDKEYIAERIALELKYHAQRVAVYDERKNIVTGATPIESQDPEGKDKKGIPGFWAQCIGNHPSIAHLVTEEDGALLASLIDVKVSFSESMDSFTLTFVFEPNDFITNQEVTKTYTISPNILDDFPQLVNVECSPIEWKEGKNLTVTEVKKKQKAKSGKNKGQIRTVTSSVPKPSFFHFFSKPLGLEGEEDQEHDEEENEANVKLHAEDDMEVAQIFRLHLIANALGWFTGEALDDLQGFGGDEEEDDDDEEGEEGDEGDEDEEDEEDESDSDGEADKKKKKGGKGKKASGAAPTGGPAGQQPECKQN